MSQALVEMAHVDASEDEQSELDELERLKSSPLRVSGIVFPQDFETRSEKVLREFKPTVSAKTLEEVLKHTDETLVNLEDLGVFHEIDAEIVQGRSVRFHPTDPILLTAISFPVTAFTEALPTPTCRLLHIIVHMHWWMLQCRPVFSSTCHLWTMCHSNISQLCSLSLAHVPSSLPREKWPGGDSECSHM